MAAGEDHDQKTEDPTQRKLDEAQEQGDVLQSTDAVSWAMLASATLLAAFWLSSGVNSLGRSLKAYFAQAGSSPLDGSAALALAWRVGADAGAFLAAPFLTLMAVAIGAHLLQRPFVANADRIQPDLKKLNPMTGFDRLFGRQALIQFGKGLFKIAAVSAVAAWVLWPERDRLPGLMELPLTASLRMTYDLVFQVLIATLIVYGVVAMGDYGWQYWERRQRLMMSRQEIKDEFKQSEGDPHVRARLKQIRLEKSRKRMMAAVPTASVVVTNPTHYAVALRYEAGMPAPVVVAKGLDLIALKIREIAADNKVPVVENPPLARALYASVELDEPVKPEHYKAVAQVIGFVMRLKAGAKGGKRV
jgi:flagellar biosynthetic protein FlhB